MIRLLQKLPRTLTLAVSGGVDSMCMLDFLRRKHDVTCAFFHHGTESSDYAYEFLKNYCKNNEIPFISEKITMERPSGTSLEEFWRDQRYKFLEKFDTVVTAHNLDDCVETWVWSSLHGQPKLIPYRRNNVVRPFLATEKQKLIEWCQRNEVPWTEDASNTNTKFTRNYIRHEMMPHVLRVNPGIRSMIKKKLFKENV